jgi:hypothetical protein
MDKLVKEAESILHFMQYAEDKDIILALDIVLGCYLVIEGVN